MKIYVASLNLWVTAWVLDSTPLVLSVNDLVENHGYEFRWKKTLQKKAELRKGTRQIKLPVKLGVPCLPVKT